MNKKIRVAAIIILVAIITIVLILVLGSMTSRVEADEGYQSIQEKVTTNVAKEVTTEEVTEEEPEVIYLEANYGPEAGEVKEIHIAEATEGDAEIAEDDTEVSSEFEEMVIASMNKEPEIETPSNLYNLTLDEQYLLTALAMCEAGNQDTEGKALIIRVVLNRVEDPRFPDNIYDVVYQPGQFTPAENGVLNSTAGDDDCWAALDMVNMQGWDESYGATYFCATYLDFGWAEYLFTHGDHNFYR